MSNTNQPNPRHVEILAEVKQCPIELYHEISCRQALTAIACAVEEATSPQNESELMAFMLINIQRMSDDKRELFIKDLFVRYPELNPLHTELASLRSDRDQWVKNWNHLDKLYQSQQSELTTLRSEVERLSGLLDKVAKLQRYHCGVDYGCLSVDYDSTGRFIEYDDLIQALEGGGDKPYNG